MKLIDNSIKTNWKYLAIVVGFAMAVGVATIIWYANSLRVEPPVPQTVTSRITPPPTPTEVDISTWQTYRNEEFGFEVRYPRDWIFKTYPQERDVLLFIGFGSKPGDLPIGAFLRVRKQIAPIADPIFSSELNKEWKITDGDEIVIDKQIGYYFKNFPGPTLIDHVYIPFNGFIYELFALIDRNNPEKFRRVFEQILSTFRFVEGN